MQSQGIKPLLVTKDKVKIWCNKSLYAVSTQRNEIQICNFNFEENKGYDNEYWLLFNTEKALYFCNG
jgi:hypothetical protein